MYISEQGVPHPAAGSAEGPGQPGRNRQGAVAWPDHQAGSLQVGHPDEHRGARVQERAQPVCAQRLRRCPDRHAAQPAVRCRQVHPAHAAAEPADADAPDQGSPTTRRCFLRASDTTMPSGMSYHKDYSSYVGDPAQQPVIATRSPTAARWRAARHREFFAHQRWEEFFPKVGYVMSWGPMRARHQVPPQFPRPESEQRMVLRHWQVHTGQTCRRS